MRSANEEFSGALQHFACRSRRCYGHAAIGATRRRHPTPPPPPALTSCTAASAAAAATGAAAAAAAAAALRQAMHDDEQQVEEEVVVCSSAAAKGCLRHKTQQTFGCTSKTSLCSVGGQAFFWLVLNSLKTCSAAQEEKLNLCSKVLVTRGVCYSLRATHTNDSTRVAVVTHPSTCCLEL